MPDTMSHHPFRFGIFSHNTSPSKHALIDQARKAEQLGYSTFLIPDHIEDQFAPFLALALVGSATSTLRIGSFVSNNDFRNPALLVKEAATLDVFSNGRFELGLGAGWMQSEYEQIGLTFDRSAIRIGRMAEAVHIIKMLFTQEAAVTFVGNRYRVQNMHGLPRPVQQPYPPIYLGGSGRHMLTLAAQEATSVGVVPKVKKASRGTHMNEVLDMEDVLPKAIEEKIAWIREAAGTRFGEIELNTVIMDMQIGPDSNQALQQLVERLGVSEKQALETPFLLAGSPDQICEKLWQTRERYGFSYIVIWEEHLERFAPIVARLAGH